MEGWIIDRQLKYRSELLFQWACLLAGEGKLIIDRIGQNPSQFHLSLAADAPRPEGTEGLTASVVPIAPVHQTPEKKEKESAMNDDKDYEPPSQVPKLYTVPRVDTEDESTNSDVDAEGKGNPRRIPRAKSEKKRKRESEPEAPPAKKPNLSGLTTLLKELAHRKGPIGHTHLERFRQIASEITKGVHMCGLVLQEVCKKQEEDKILVKDITHQIKEMSASSKEDQVVIHQLREEITNLQWELRQRESFLK